MPPRIRFSTWTLKYNKCAWLTIEEMLEQYRPAIVESERDAKTVSSETTFDTDYSDLATLEQHLWRLSEKVSTRLKASQLSGKTTTLKLKTSDFRQRTRAQSIEQPSQLADRIFRIARQMLIREIDGTAYRLIGAGVSALRPAGEAEDSELLDHRSAKAEYAMDDLRKRFGNDAVVKGIAFKTNNS